NALPHFQNLLDKKLSAKKLAQVHYNIGVCFYRLNQTNSAITEFKQAISLNPNYEKAFYALGMAFSDLKDFNDAENAFRAALKLSNNGETWFDLGLVLSEQKKYDEAFVSFQNAIKFGSVAASASHNNLGVISAWKGDFKLAEKEIELSKNLGFTEAENNLKILRKAMISNDKTLIGKLILQEKIN
ncbi:MAG: tetratricopeptide repeat protein, partial [Acidobacteriota bacterium]